MQANLSSELDGLDALYPYTAATSFTMHCDQAPFHPQYQTSTKGRYCCYC